VDTTRTGKTRKKSAKIPGSKPAKKSVTHSSSDAVHHTVIADHSQVAHDAAEELRSTESVLSGHFISVYDD